MKTSRTTEKRADPRTKMVKGTAANSHALNRLLDSAGRGELVAIVGSGVSVGLTDGTIPALSWKGLIDDGFSYGVKKGKITNEQAAWWKAQLGSTDIDDLLGAAEFMGRKLNSPNGDLYARWLENAFRSVNPTNRHMADAINSLQAAGIPICTLNYDSLLERVTGLPTLTLAETGKVMGWMRNELPGILHLHGSWEAPGTCVLGIRDYETTLSDDVRDLIQRDLAAFRRLLFIGCGDTFADPNFSALIEWLRRKMKTAAPEHYALVLAAHVEKRELDIHWHGFVEPLSFGRKYSDLSKFLASAFKSGSHSVAQLKRKAGRAPSRNAANEKLLSEYRSFLVKDCGQMTIEGVRADMDIGQRRFDLERLFVPLKCLQAPPDIPDSDPNKAQKLLEWQEGNKKPRRFGDVLVADKHIALLALPGGGKTLLLKRLAVAYADPGRRQASKDNLPDSDLMPVLIRCREWREHIHRPIPTLLQRIPEITGKPALSGLGDALLPLFKKGRILLLVDGLDEIHDDALRSTFVEHLESFIEENSSTRLVVTSREAGFSLVAPCLARFCHRWRVAPLESDAITLLCSHWHRLMIGRTAEADAESDEVARYLLRNGALLRLAENPLLLTMLLVVKHGAGRLPPDRVSLYSRAVEVLLDTWNIKGHDPLNPKEAVPQLAFVAFELMRDGKQTATEKELLSLLEIARDKVPQIRRYAKDTPYEFLKRVELRSSLLVEAGHQIEGGSTVPFYQFRHLTFQEYLAAVAAVEGHYTGYAKNDTVLTPLSQCFLTEEWKEVIPMAAVLARKQAEPLIAALLREGELAKAKFLGRESAREDDEVFDDPRRDQPAVARLVQCLVEEAEAAPETLVSALRLLALFARGCISRSEWSALCHGPYGDDLLHQAWLLYHPMNWPDETRLIDSYPHFAAWRHSRQFWSSAEGAAELERLLTSEKNEDIVRGLFSVAGVLHVRTSRPPLYEVVAPLIAHIERYLESPDPAIWAAAARAWGWFQRNQPQAPKPYPSVLDRLVSLWLGDARVIARDRAGFAILYAGNVPRESWKPSLSDGQVKSVKATIAKKRALDDYRLKVSLIIAFYSGCIYPEEELATRIAQALDFAADTKRGHEAEKFRVMLDQMGAVGAKHLRSISIRTTRAKA